MTETKVEQKTLREWRERLGLKQWELCELANVHRSAIGKVEQGLIPFDSGTGRKVLRALEDLGIPADQIRPDRTKLKDIESSVIWSEDGLADDAPARTLAQWRVARGLSATDLGILAGVHDQTIRKIERGARRDAHGPTRRALAKALRVRPDKLLFPSDKKLPEREQSPEAYLRAELRGARRALRRSYDFLRDDSNISLRNLGKRDALLPEIERELKGT